MPGSSKWSPSLRFLHQTPVCNSLLPHTCYMPRPSHSSWFDHPNDVWWGVQIVKLLILYVSPLPCHFVPLRPKYLPKYHNIKHCQPMFLPQCESKIWHPYIMRSKITVLIILGFNFWTASWKGQNSALNSSKHSFLWPVPKFCIDCSLICSRCSQISELFQHSNHLLSIFIL